MRIGLVPLLLMVGCVLPLSGCQSSSSKAGHINISNSRSCSIEMDAIVQDTADSIQRNWKVSDTCEIEFYSDDETEAMRNDSKE